jgi:hypothetical protein
VSVSYALGKRCNRYIQTRLVCWDREAAVLLLFEEAREEGLMGAGLLIGGHCRDYSVGIYVLVYGVVLRSYLLL